MSRTGIIHWQDQVAVFFTSVSIQLRTLDEFIELFDSDHELRTSAISDGYITIEAGCRQGCQVFAWKNQASGSWKIDYARGSSCWLTIIERDNGRYIFHDARSKSLVRRLHCAVCLPSDLKEKIRKARFARVTYHREPQSSDEPGLSHEPHVRFAPLPGEEAMGDEDEGDEGSMDTCTHMSDLNQGRDDAAQDDSALFSAEEEQTDQTIGDEGVAPGTAKSMAENIPVEDILRMYRERKIGSRTVDTYLALRGIKMEYR